MTGTFPRPGLTIMAVAIASAERSAVEVLAALRLQVL